MRNLDLLFDNIRMVTRDDGTFWTTQFHDNLTGQFAEIGLSGNLAGAVAYVMMAEGSSEVPEDILEDAQAAVEGLPENLNPLTLVMKKWSEKQ